MISRAHMLWALLLVLFGFPLVCHANDLADGWAAWKAGNYAKAMALLQPFAEKGNPNAQDVVGQMYADGKGVPKNLALATRWFFREASNGGAVLADSEIPAVCHDNDYGSAVASFREAAHHGDNQAQCILGLMYAEGYCHFVPRNDAKAIMWLRLAAAQGNPLAKRLLLFYVKNPLADAAGAGDLKEVKRLLASGAAVNAFDAKALTPLMEAVTGGHKQIVELLLSHGADVNRTIWPQAETPLDTAVEKNHPDLVEILLAHGADPNRVGSVETPLDYAVRRQSRNLVQLLLAHGANINATNLYGLTPLNLLASYGEISDSLSGRSEFAIFLIVHGANPYIKDDEGNTVFDQNQYMRRNEYGAVNFHELFSPRYQQATPSFDCHGGPALTYVESEICAIPQLRYLDRKLSDAYSAALKVAPDPATVREEQREWLRYRNEKCNSDTSRNASMNPCSFVILREMYIRRTTDLSLLAKGAIPEISPKNWPGGPKPVPGATAAERGQFLKNLLSPADAGSPDDSKVVPYLLTALHDPSEKVRDLAVGSVVDEAFLPYIIHAMVNDPDPRVRQDAALTISNYITSNGGAGCDAVGTVSAQLGEFILALREDSTAPWAVQVLGADDNNTALPCCMTRLLKAQVVKALEAWAGKTPAVIMHTGSQGGSAIDALHNIAACSVPTH